MTRSASVTLAALAAGVVAWLGFGVLIDQRVAATLTELEQAASRDGSLIVHRFDYAPGLLAGRLEYDLEWRPRPDSEWFLLAEGIRSVAADALRIEGAATVRHGPWVGGGQPWAMARTTARVELPEALRDSLPDYPAEQPLLILVGTLGFDGGLEGAVRGATYDGDLQVGPDAVALAFAGLDLSFTATADLATGRLALALDRLHISPPAAELLIEGLRATLATTSASPPGLDLAVSLSQFVAGMDTARLELEGFELNSQTVETRPDLWTGDASGRLTRMRIGNGIFTGEFQGIEGTTRAELTAAGHYDTHAGGEVVGLRLNDAVIGSLSLAGGVRNLDPQAYGELVRLDPATDIVDTLQRLWAAQPEVALDRLALTLPDAGVIAASLTVTGRGRMVLDPSQPAAVLEDILAEGRLDIPRPTLRRLVEIGVGIINPALQGVEREVRVDDLLVAVTNTLAESPLLSVSPDGVRADLQIADGRVTVNGEHRMTVTELAEVFIDTPEPAIAPAFLLPEFNGEPRVARVSLSAGFGPQPHVVPVMATGREGPQTVLGVDCPGRVLSPQPDVTFSYAAGPDHGLYLYAESDDDVTLLVLGPDGWRCDDDSHGSFDPGVIIEAPLPGDYRIWVGTYQAGETEAMLGITEF